MKTINTAAQSLLIRLLLMCMLENIINQTDPCSPPAQLEQPAGGYLKISFDQSGPVQHPWSSSSQEECSEVTVRFAERGISTTYLHSLPYLHIYTYTYLQSLPCQHIYTAYHIYISTHTHIYTAYHIYISTQCSEVTVRFAERGSLRMRALVSFPRSGNTWLRWGGHRSSLLPGPSVRCCSLDSLLIKCLLPCLLAQCGAHLSQN